MNLGMIYIDFKGILYDLLDLLCNLHYMILYWNYICYILMDIIEFMCTFNIDFLCNVLDMM